MTELPEGVIATALATTYTIEISGGDPHLDEFNDSVLMMSVRRKGPNSWGIYRFSQYFGSDGQWSFRPDSSMRQDEWLATHRFDLETALKLAQVEALRIYANKRARFAELGRK